MQATYRSREKQRGKENRESQWAKCCCGCRWKGNFIKNYEVTFNTINYFTYEFNPFHSIPMTYCLLLYMLRLDESMNMNNTMYVLHVYKKLLTIG